MENYISGIEKIELPGAFGYSLFITVASVFVIILCTSMCAWYIRVKNKGHFRDVYAVCILNDYTFSNGNVYIIQK